MNILAEKIELAQLIFTIQNKVTINKIKKFIASEQPDLWDELNDNVKADVEIAIKQLDKGEGIPHSQAVKKLKRWVK